MTPIIISSILSLISSVFGSVTQEQQAKLTLLLEENKDLNQLMSKQADIDETEAQSTNWFVASWRPLVGWVCAISFAWQYLLLPVSSFICVVSGHPEKVTQLQSLHLDYSTMSSVLFGMLGLGTMRSWEKYNNVQNNH